MKTCSRTLYGCVMEMVRSQKRRLKPAATLLAGFFFFSLVGYAQDAPSKKQRIISSAPVVTEILYAIGAGDEVVGTDDYSHYPPEAEKVKKIGGLGNLSVETLIALKPTLVVIYGKQPELEAFCKQRGVAKVNVMIEGIHDIFKTITTLGRATEREEQAAKLDSAIHKQLEAVAKHTARSLHGGGNNIDGGKKEPPTKSAPRVLITIGREAGSFQNVLTIGRGSFLDALLLIAGGDNVFADMKQPYPMISAEQIIAAAPDVIIEIAGEAKGHGDVEKKKKDWAVFKSVPAVKSGRIEFLSDDYLLIPGPRIGKIAEDLVKVLHPEKNP
jgi:iron complex transport system substrate-binding protein